VEKVNMNKTRQAKDGKSRVGWIDALRGIAILAVVSDHALALFPGFPTSLIHPHLMFSVIWLILLSGISASLSSPYINWRKPATWVRFWKKRLVSLLPLYLIATLLFYLIFYPTHSLGAFLSITINFRAASLFYFVRILTKLMILFPLLYIWKTQVKHPWVHALLIAILSYIAFRVAPMQYPPWLYSLTSLDEILTFLIPYFIGILFASHLGTLGIIPLIVSAAVFLWLEYVGLTRAMVFVGIIPNFPQTLWSISLFVLMTVPLRIPALLRYAAPLRFIGRHSYEIFLFHFLILRIIYPYMPFRFHPILFLDTILLSVIVSILIGSLYRYVILKGRTYAFSEVQ
jgi:peptidoglycan/LPS O-acetylase OafA/YrhL